MSDKTTGVLVQHQAALAEGRFLIQKCDGCGQHIYFPREICPHCGSDAVQFVSPSGQGTVYAVTTVRRKPADGGDYNVSLIDLDEGPRLMSRVDNVKPDDVKIGQRVTARVVVADDKGVVVFDAVGGAA
ncbi:Zn-ribbon domain-containing OB-fold protein [Limnohabitans sp. B9-3]|uniref:Zn-ribbon domain-containing OB-fold protein n=1 Tax=Limnohabitans sp. B9-3 TaxID=1100707 RepID=UPI000C1E3C42|nr:OB-fold domain-containing protein [Limnohabitans sp. B9-3]PIT77532.1 DNA-binding protein [Limnohabitans sp. B9-3]